MRTTLQKSQKVLTPDGEGTVLEIIGETVTVQLNTGEEKTFREEELLDDSDAGYKESGICRFLLNNL